MPSIVDGLGLVKRKPPPTLAQAILSWTGCKYGEAVPNIHASITSVQGPGEDWEETEVLPLKLDRQPSPKPSFRLLTVTVHRKGTTGPSPGRRLRCLECPLPSSLAHTQTRTQPPIHGGLARRPQDSRRVLQVYEGQVEASEAREEVEMLRLKLESATQEVEEARQAAAAAQSALAAALAAQATSGTPADSPSAATPPDVSVSQPCVIFCSVTLGDFEPACRDGCLLCITVPVQILLAKKMAQPH